MPKIMGDNYRAWEVKEESFPHDGSPQEQSKFLARYGILAASIHNTQPWKVKVVDGGLDILPDWRYKLAIADPHGKNLYISLGCFVKNIEVAARYFGFSTRLSSQLVDIIDPSISLRTAPISQPAELSKLFPYITQRYSNKRPYVAKDLEPNILTKLLDGIENNGSKVQLIGDKSLIKQAAILQNQALFNASKIEGFAEELSGWLKLEDSEEYDGMPSFVAGIPKEQAAQFQKALVESPAVMAVLGKGDQVLIETSPVIGVICTHQDSPEMMVSVGRTYQELALRTFQNGLSITPMQSIIEDQGTLMELKKLLKMDQFTPQMFFRMGYADNQPYHTPRRHLEESLV